MNATVNNRDFHSVHERDNESWQHQIDEAIATPDPILANLRITAAHYQLSMALHEILGPATGANFHTWATWGSKKAGQTIRQEEAPWLGAVARLIGAILGLLVAAMALHQPWSDCLPTRAGAMVIGMWLLPALAQRRRDYASRMVLGGNIVVLDDIGRQTARFVSLFHGHAGLERRRFDAFIASLRPGPTVSGGQDLLKSAFTHYYQARYASSRAQQYEEVLLANLYAILHEHLRLQPYIAGAMPRLAQRLITRYLLNFSLGRRTMSVGSDVVPLHRLDSLTRVESAELRAFLGAWGRDGGAARGSRARNWADIRDRMAFICALFRTGQCDQGLFTDPYSDTQWAELEAGRVPQGAL